MRTVKTKSGVRHMPSLEEIKEATEEQQGFCIACGEIADGVEPDARNYTCEYCGFSEVFGADELVLMGWVY